ncbi:putative Transposon TX1 [Gossypium australe]|uniref:Putative Transposon TX1 n=1 Tax=Gossypium australe TaxID=47621 RepID=A0A5B6VAT4_9ROSI|nr:putative Transposon TX1 [Gossypium australe]
MEMVRLKCGFENGIDIGSMGSRGGFFSSYHIDVEVHDIVCEVKWRLTGFYGNPDKRGRSASWNLLRQLSNNNSILWVVLGDFNEIANSFEKKGGCHCSERQMLAFRSALEECNLTDLGYRGRWFTWERGRVSSTNIRERLDRGVATLSWLELFPRFQTPRAERIDYTNNLNNFRFEAKWCLESSFEELVRGWWVESVGSIPNKLEILGHKMQVWSKSRNMDEKRKWVCLEERLNYLYKQDISDDILAKIVEVQLGLNLEADKEELFWEQRARVNWLKNGDRNTSFFS